MCLQQALCCCLLRKAVWPCTCMHRCVSNTTLVGSPENVPNVAASLGSTHLPLLLVSMQSGYMSKNQAIWAAGRPCMLPPP